MDLKSKKKLLIILAIVVVALIASLLFIKHQDNQKGKATQTGGDYSPVKTQVVFHDSNKLYEALRSDEIDTLRAKLADQLQNKYGEGTYDVQVVDDKLNYTPSESGIPPSFSLTITVDDKPTKFQVDVDMSSGKPVFTIKSET
ncbi:MAG TPA: hypothetical protein VMY99_00830 [Nevskiaceae bacterium]|nr:hypothetical protein [Nevskiaceae bacterium]